MMSCQELTIFSEIRRNFPGDGENGSGTFTVPLPFCYRGVTVSATVAATVEPTGKYVNCLRDAI